MKQYEIKKLGVLNSFATDSKTTMLKFANDNWTEAKSSSNCRKYLESIDNSYDWYGLFDYTTGKQFLFIGGDVLAAVYRLTEGETAVDLNFKSWTDPLFQIWLMQLREVNELRIKKYSITLSGLSAQEKDAIQEALRPVIGNVHWEIKNV